MATTVGILWDQYLPSTEGQLTRDLIAIQSSGGKEISAFCPDDSADRLLKALGIARAVSDKVAKLWITYKTTEEPVQAPDWATTVIERDLFVDKADTHLDDSPHPGYFMRPQGRIIAPTVDLNKPMPNHGLGVTDPMLTLLWGPN